MKFAKVFAAVLLLLFAVTLTPSAASPLPSPQTVGRG